MTSLFRKAGHDDHGRIRVKRFDLLEQINARTSRHHEIGKDQIDRFASEQTESLLAGTGLHYPILAESPLTEFTDKPFVVDNQHGCLLYM